ncbi:hypothetical protein CLV92_11461 [Kineococcus xinjiangensis]|uniref:Uncharacterized protein n=1 Tax=Kineococcus xinjiangensis TaxID=512762 RepID=A0A2S6IE75_9ACTN|nr:hypothetical protein [Kineococcus xinjiangensis]PPK92460.1 hypothetical protein CLV92_11461 [Kineococcus xinjiangensis]
MQIPKDQILQLLQSRGETGKAQQAEGQLPDQVDPEQHSGLLSSLGIDPQELISMVSGLGGKGGGGLGGIAGKLGL